MLCIIPFHACQLLRKMNRPVIAHVCFRPWTLRLKFVQIVNVDRRSKKEEKK